MKREVRGSERESSRCTCGADKRDTAERGQHAQVTKWSAGAEVTLQAALALMGQS